MRKLLNILAVIIGAMSGLFGVAGAAMVVAALFTGFKQTPPFTADLRWLMLLLMGGGFCFLGFLIASRALLHLRHPDAGTVRDMIGTAIYLIVMGGVWPVGTSLKISGSVPALSLSNGLLACTVGLYLFHRYLVKRIIARAFPPDAAPPTFTSTA